MLSRRLRSKSSCLLLLGLAQFACRQVDSEYPAVRVSDSVAGAFEAAMTPYGAGLAVAWYDTRDGNGEIYLRLVDADGRPVGEEHRLTEDAEDSYEVSLASVGDALAVAWYGRRSDDGLRAYLGVWDPALGWHWQTNLSASRQSRNPVVRARGRSIFGAWIEADGVAGSGEQIRFAFWSQDGRQLAEPQSLAFAGAETWHLNAALDPDRETAFVVYDAPDRGGVYELFLARIGGGRTAISPLTASDGFASKYPDIAVADVAGETLAGLTWFDEKDGNQETYLSIAPVASLGETPVDGVARRVSNSRGSSMGSYLAWNGDRVGVAWSDESSATYDVLFGLFDREALPVREIANLTQTAAGSFVPAIVADGEGFAIAWNEIPGGDDDSRGSVGSEVFLTYVRPAVRP